MDRWEKDLPTFAQLKRAGTRVPLESVFPPDSDTAWASIYTGQDPAKHGVLSFTDALSKSADHQARDVDASSVRGLTLWDVASRAGKRVCVLHPHIGYPPWQVNGVFVGRSSVEDRVVEVPEGATGGFDLSRLNLTKGFPDARDKGRYVDHHVRLVDAQRELSVKMQAQEEWDLLYVYSSSLDMVKHFFWSACDESDPEYDPRSPWKDVIHDLYVQHDRWIGDLIRGAPSGAAVMVVGDHGHGRRPKKVVHLNELLRQRGFLRKTKGVKSPAGAILDWTKATGLRAVSRLHLENLAAKALRAFPGARRYFTRPPNIDWDGTEAYMSDLSGIKAYSYGGIRLKSALPDERKARLRGELMEVLRELRDPETGSAILAWGGTREELYSGRHLHLYPDVLYRFHSEWGASPVIGKGLFGESPAHAIVPGTHRIDTPDFLIGGAGVRPAARPARMMDVGVTALAILGLEPEQATDGRSLVKDE